MEPSSYTIEVQKLRKRYGKLDAVDGISFRVDKGQIVGFLGPNGAGKSTTMRILAGYTRASSGVARICGLSVAAQPREIKRRIGYMAENNPLPEELRVSEYLSWRAAIKEIPRAKRRQRIGSALEQCDLGRASRRIIGKLSKGYRQRVGIADAILAAPEVIIMDEPTIGLDPHQVVMIRDLIARLRGEMTVVISSHILPEIEMTCDRIVIINGGKIVGEGTPQELRDTFIDATRYRVEICGELNALRQALAPVDSSLEVRQCGPIDGDGYWEAEIRLQGRRDCGERLFQTLARQPELRPRSLQRRQASLEEVFLAATRRSWETVDPDLAAKAEPRAPAAPSPNPR